MNYHLDRLYKILTHARTLAENGRWEDLEEYADSKLEESMSLAEKAVASKLGKMLPFSEENDWEFYTTLTGSHAIDLKIGNVKFYMSLNLEGDKPILSLT